MSLNNKTDQILESVNEQQKFAGRTECNKKLSSQTKVYAKLCDTDKIFRKQLVV